MSTSGVPCASSTGHFLVRDCPGGIRFSRRVSGLMMISGSSISSGLRGSVVWYLGSLKRLLRKLIAILLILQIVEFCHRLDRITGFQYVHDYFFPFLSASAINSSGIHLPAP